MYHHSLIKLTHYDETKKRAHDSQVAMIAKEDLKLSHGGPSQRQASGTNGLKLYVRAVIESAL